jgi:hypothetical protein
LGNNVPWLFNSIAKSLWVVWNGALAASTVMCPANFQLERYCGVLEAWDWNPFFSSAGELLLNCWNQSLTLSRTAFISL